MSVAIDAATVDLPSLAKHEVKPMTLARFALLFWSTVSFIDRMASAYGDNGDSIIVRMTFEVTETLLGAIALSTDIAFVGCLARN